jgi:hypothetical protein
MAWQRDGVDAQVDTQDDAVAPESSEISQDIA